MVGGNGLDPLLPPYKAGLIKGRDCSPLFAPDYIFRPLMSIGNGGTVQLVSGIIEI